MSITHSVVNRQLERLVSESDPRAWKETLAVLCTYATTDEFAPLCDALAARLRGPGNDERSATLCYICAGNVDRTVQIWLEQVCTDIVSEITSASINLL
jgi:protein transport protein SEC31